MDLPDAQDKLAELKEQLEKPHGKLAGFLFFFFFIKKIEELWNSNPIQNIYVHELSLMQKQVNTYSKYEVNVPVANTSCHSGEIKQLSLIIPEELSAPLCPLEARSHHL